MVESTGLEIWRSEEATLTELSGLGIWVIGATFWKDRVYTKKRRFERNTNSFSTWDICRIFRLKFLIGG